MSTPLDECVWHVRSPSGYVIASYGAERHEPDFAKWSEGGGEWRVTRNRFTPRAPWLREVVATCTTEDAARAALRIMTGGSP